MKMSNGFVKISLIIGICVGSITITKVGLSVNNKIIDSRVSKYIGGCGMSRKIDTMARDISDIKLILAIINKGNPDYEDIKKLINEK